MKTQEIDSIIPIAFDRLQDLIKKELREQPCVSCHQVFNENKDITYVQCYSGEIRWWHTPKVFYKKKKGISNKVTIYCREE